MIDQQLIDSAKYIRKNFVDLTNTLSLYREDVKNLADFLKQKIEEIRKYNEETIKKMKSKEQLGVITEHLIKELNSIEDEEKKLHKKVEGINKELEKLKAEEQILYKTIKERYPEMTDQQIIKEIHQHL
jgi:chromosome segregation ATPase